VERLEDRTVPSAAAAAAALAASYGQLPLAFQANQGQGPAAFNYLAQGGDYTLGLSASEAVLGLVHSGPGGSGTAGTALAMNLVGANPAAQAVASDPLASHTNYLDGSNPSGWVTNVPNYGQVTYQNVYQGTDLTYSGSQGQLEYTFTVNPGAKVSAIQLGFQGQQALSLDAQGDLVLQTAGGPVKELAPVAYQVNADGSHTAVACKFVLEGSGQVGFQVGAYDPGRALVIDPSLSYSTYLSAINYSVAVDGAGDAYVTGFAPGTFPTTAGAFQPTGNGIFVAELNPAGTGLVYATFLGNNPGAIGGGGSPISYTFATGIAVDGAGDAYVTGTTKTGFPITPNALSSTFNDMGFTAAGEGFLSVLNPTGSGLIYSTYLPAVQGGWTAGRYADDAVAVDASGNAYLTGTALAGLPTTAGAYQATGSGAFLMEINPNLSGAQSLVYSSYLGAGNGTGVAVDGSGNAYVTGLAQGGFPTTPGAFSTTGGAFIAKVDPALSGPASLVYATRLGGNGTDGVMGNVAVLQPEPGPAIAVDGAGNAYVTGTTTSTNFPTTPGAFQTSSHNSGNPIILASDGDVFVTKLNPTGTALDYSTYLGGSARDAGTGIAVDASGDAYVTGWTRSSDFPTQSPLQAQKAGGTDNYGLPTSAAFVTELNPSGSGLLFSTYLGGSKDTYGYGLALGPGGNVYVAGATYSSDFPTTAGAFQTAPANGFVAEINPTIPFAVSGLPSATTAGVPVTFTVTATDSSGNTLTDYTGTVHFTSSDPQAVLPADYTFSAADQGSHTFTVTFKTAGSESLAITDTGTGNGVSAGGIAVSPAAASQLVLSGPSSVASGTAFNVTATAEDPYGNVATGYAGTVHFSSMDPQATLPGNYTFTAADKGVHTFTKLKLKAKGSQRVTATDTKNSSITGSLPITVT
jgi:hypothetical protein